MGPRETWIAFLKNPSSGNRSYLPFTAILVIIVILRLISSALGI